MSLKYLVPSILQIELRPGAVLSQNQPELVNKTVSRQSLMPVCSDSQTLRKASRSVQYTSADQWAVCECSWSMTWGFVQLLTPAHSQQADKCTQGSTRLKSFLSLIIYKSISLSLSLSYAWLLTWNCCSERLTCNNSFVMSHSCRADVSKFKFEGKTFYVIGVQREVKYIIL